MKRLFSIRRTTLRRDQDGVAAVEFAVIATVFFAVLFGIMEMGWLLWTWNAAAEATRFGARLAVVCSMDDQGIKDRIRIRLPGLTDSQIDIDYLNPPNAENSCTADTCKEVRVRLEGKVHQPLTGLFPLSVTLPPFQTTLPREFMNSTGNAICN